MRASPPLLLLLGLFLGGQPSTEELPQPRWQGLPGWLGFAAVRPGSELREGWTPQHPKAQVVLFSEAWKSVPSGTKVKLLSTAGLQDGTYLGTSDERYGCEENTATLAGFRAAAPLPEGPVWVLPREDAGGSTALPVKEVPPTSLSSASPKGKVPSGKKARAFEAGGLGFLLTRSAPQRGQLTVLLEGRRVASMPISKGEMAGSDQSPLNLHSAEEVGVPLPLVAFQLGQGGPVVVVLGMNTNEGHSFVVAVRRGDQVELLQKAGEYLYFCAF